MTAVESAKGDAVSSDEDMVEVSDSSTDTRAAEVPRGTRVSATGCYRLLNPRFYGILTAY